MPDDSRVEVAMAGLDKPTKHAWLNTCVIPRPIAWVSTVSATGQGNLAPHSYFTVASVDPPVVAFTSVGTKDTLRNVRDTGEFVISITTHALAEQVNRTSARFDRDVNELIEADSDAIAADRRRAGGRRAGSHLDAVPGDQGTSLRGRSQRIGNGLRGGNGGFRRAGGPRARRAAGSHCRRRGDSLGTRSMVAPGQCVQAAATRLNTAVPADGRSRR